MPELDKRGIYYYFQYTLNDYEADGLEPNVPPIEARIDTFRRLHHLLGPERIIWRFDPIILTPQLTPRDILYKIWNVGNRLRGLTNKLVFSFADIAAYKKVQRNLQRECTAFKNHDVLSAEPDAVQQREIVEGLVKIRDRWSGQGWPVMLATCGEGIDLAQYGIEHNRCIDGELFARIAPDDENFSHWLKSGKLPDTGLLPLAGIQPAKPIKPAAMKDKGQRKECGCIISKDIGMYNTCRHFCVYCYANTSRNTVTNKIRAFDPGRESIIPF